MRSAPLLAVLVCLGALAGCFGDDPVPDARRFQATGGSVSPGWAYDGAGLQAASATLDGQLSNGANAGVVNVSFQLAGSTWTATIDEFSQAEGRDFQDGGVAFELDEHGDTGVADASIPRIRAIIAAWGSARVMRDGALVTPEPWSAHLMLSADTVRGADGRITKADGATPYDPNAPADARRVEGDPQGLLFLKHPMGETFSRAPEPLSVALVCDAPGCADEAELAVAPDVASLANITFRILGPATPVQVGPVGRGHVSIVDANGTEIAGADVAPGAQGTTVVVPTAPDLAAVAFPLKAQLTGDGAFQVLVEATATYDDHPFIVLTWDEIVVESA